MITCIIFDVGNVLVRNGKFPQSVMLRLADVLDLEASKLTIRYNYLLPRLEEGKGRLSRLLGKNGVAGLIRNYQKSAEKVFALNEELFELALKLKKNYRVGIISNIDKYLAEIPLHQKVYRSLEPNLVVLSYRVGTRKPKKEIYRIFLKRAGCLPKNTLFIDNTKENVTTARKIGMKGIVFKNNRQLKKEMVHFLG